MKRAFIILMCMVVATVITAFFRMSDTVSEQDLPVVATSAPASTSRVSQPVDPEIPADKTLFRSEPFRFTLLIPKDTEIQEFKEAGDARTYVFSDTDGKSFQIYVTPHGKEIIDTERFKLDAPSGVMDARQDITIGGAPATTFLGKDNMVGDTREVWFIREGLLYEVVTIKDLDAWLSEIMTSWTFI